MKSKEMIAFEKKKSVATDLKRCKEMFPAEANHTLTVRCCGENPPRYEAARLKCRYLAPGYKQLMAFLTVEPSLIKRMANSSNAKDGVALLTKKHPEVSRWLSSLLDFFLALHTGHAEDTSFAKCLRAHRNVLTTLVPPLSLTQSAQLWRQFRKTMKEVKREKNKLKKSHGGANNAGLSTFMKFEVFESFTTGFFCVAIGVFFVATPGGVVLGLPLVLAGVYYCAKGKYALDASNEART